MGRALITSVPVSGLNTAAQHRNDGGGQANDQQFSDLAMLVPESKYGSWGNWILSFPIIGTGYWRKHDRHYYIGQ